MINSENSAFSRHTRSGNVIDDVCVKTSFYNVFTHNNPKATDKKVCKEKVALIFGMALWPTEPFSL